MKQYGKRLGAIILTAILACSLGTTTVFAASDATYTKNENVYARLEQDGDVKGTYVVNTFHVTKAGDITDYGDYDKVQNLTTLDEIKTDHKEHTFYTEEGQFSYQGDINKAELPWLFDITYVLDGDEVEQDELAGKSGDLEIHMHIRKNPSVTDKTFYEGYLLQITCTLDPDLCENIKAKGGTIADAGSNQQITYLVNPGTGADIKITAEVEAFEMDDITVTAIATKDSAKSFVDTKNKKMGTTTFLISAEGVTIPDPEPFVAEEEHTNFLDKIVNLFR